MIGTVTIGAAVYFAAKKGLFDKQCKQYLKRSTIRKKMDSLSTIACEVKEFTPRSTHQALTHIEEVAGGVEQILSEPGTKEGNKPTTSPGQGQGGSGSNPPST